MREKLIKLLCEANSLSVDADLFEDSSYAQQLEIEADHLIANGVTFAKDNNVPSWIPVTERLPEENRRVLVCLSSKVTVVAYLRENIWYVAWNRAALNNITHWMPLPEAPKEVE